MRVASVAGCPAPSSRRWLALLFVLALLVSCPACSSGRKPVQPVRGRVLVNGKPAAKAQVLFHSAQGGEEEPKPSGQTDEQGYFTLTSYNRSDGAPEGDYAVTVTWFRVARSGNQELVPYNVLPRRYADRQTSQLRAAINQGSNELPPFQLSAR
jgi:hypothetical protein